MWYSNRGNSEEFRWCAGRGNPFSVGVPCIWTVQQLEIAHVWVGGPGCRAQWQIFWKSSWPLMQIFLMHSQVHPFQFDEFEVAIITIVRACTDIDEPRRIKVKQLRHQKISSCSEEFLSRFYDYFLSWVVLSVDASWWLPKYHLTVYLHLPSMQCSG